MKNKLVTLLAFIIIVVISSYAVKTSIKKRIYQELNQTEENLQKRINELNQRIIEKEFGANTLKELVSNLKTYQVFDENGEVPLIRLGRNGDGGYLVAKTAIEKADALLGYGIQDDISFEEDFSNKYKKPSYGYDCSTKEIKINNPLTHFISECIGTDKFLYGSNNSMLVSSFSEQMKKLNLTDKNVFIKLDIEGAEYDSFSEILNHSDNITGIAMELHIVDEINDSFSRALKLLKEINNKFYLINVHGNNCHWETFTAKNLSGRAPRLLELAFINKNLVTKAQIDKNQVHPSNKLDLPTCQHKKELFFEIKD